MKTILRGLVAVLAVTGVAAPVDGQLTSVSPSCVFSILNPAANFCSGAWAGNNANQQAAVLAQIQTDWGVTATYAGTTDAGLTTGPFSQVSGGATGTVTFQSPVYGDFILALKAANQFSLYYFTGVSNLSVISYTTNGIALNKQGRPQGLSHASLYTTRTFRVPEPSAILLLATGLLGLALIRRREGQFEA